ncbi:MAG: phospholipid carrier-dependent glycosyltransferase [Candidatus Sumerlaeaceae bacterium]|nr:phospholipid carrier-dependent glycosyltransferase [Candidatus Sumerlaeaceae bacterium]
MRIEPVVAATPASPKAWIALGIMCLIYLALAFPAVVGKSVTVDEGGNIPVGYNILSTGDFRYCEYHPPLMNLLLAAPVKMFEPEATTTTLKALPDNMKFKFWPNSYVFADRFRNDYQHVIVLARTTTVLLVAGLGVLLFLWARMLAPVRGDVAGLLAAGLVWFSPNILAHSTLASSDAGIMIFTTVALWSFHCFLTKPDLPQAALAGLGLGLALLTKGTAVFLVLLYPVLAWVWRAYHPQTTLKTLLRGFAVLLLVALWVVNSGFLFQGSFTLAGKYTLESGAMKTLFAFVPKWLPVPLPLNFVGAFDRQLREASEGYNSFLFGQALMSGRWYYYLALLSIKTPLTSMALVGTAMWAAWRAGFMRRFESWMLLIPAGVLFFAFSVLSHKQLGIRMIMPAAVLFWLWCSVALASSRLGRRFDIAALVLALGTVATTAWTCPNYIAYFNPFAGDADRAHRLANDSNLDWGQDLIGLKKYMDEKKLDSIQLLYFGRIDPAIYGIKYTVPKLTEIKPGPLAVSVTLYGTRAIVTDHGRGVPMNGMDPQKLGLGAPITSIGHSIQIYDVPAKPLSAEKK